MYVRSIHKCIYFVRMYVHKSSTRIQCSRGVSSQEVTIENEITRVLISHMLTFWYIRSQLSIQLSHPGITKMPTKDPCTCPCWPLDVASNQHLLYTCVCSIPTYVFVPAYIHVCM